MEEVKVSICCLVYNHEKYLRRCLESLLEKETNFIYEILVHDDASTDKSTEIIREFEKKYPEIIKPIYQTENQYSKGVNISWTYQYPRAEGKYLAWCEGDDFWSDPKKLQLQYETLEKYENCGFCAHSVLCVSEDGKSIQGKYPDIELSDGILKSEKWIEYLLKENRYLFQTSSYFMRKEIIQKEKLEIPEFVRISPVGDIALMLLAALKGDAYFIKRPMSCYRKNSNGSWNVRVYSNTEKRIENTERTILSLKSYKKFSNHKFDHYVDIKILWNEFSILLLKEKYKELFQNKYRCVLNQRSKKEKFYLGMGAYCPWLKKLYDLIR